MKSSACETSVALMRTRPKYEICLRVKLGALDALDEGSNETRNGVDMAMVTVANCPREVISTIQRSGEQPFINIWLISDTVKHIVAVMRVTQD